MPCVLTVFVNPSHSNCNWNAKLSLIPVRLSVFQLLGHSDVRVTMRYVRTVEESKRAAVDAVQLNSRKNVHVLASWPKQPPLPAAVNG
jgi:hypothetical protein